MLTAIIIIIISSYTEGLIQGPLGLSNLGATPDGDAPCPYLHMAEQRKEIQAFFFFLIALVI